MRSKHQYFFKLSRRFQRAIKVLWTTASIETKALKEETELLWVIHHNFHQLPPDHGFIRVIWCMPFKRRQPNPIPYCGWCGRVGCSKPCFWEFPRIHILLSFNCFCFLPSAEFCCWIFKMCSLPLGLEKHLYPYSFSHQLPAMAISEHTHSLWWVTPAPLCLTDSSEAHHWLASRFPFSYTTTSKNQALGICCVPAVAEKFLTVCAFPRMIF